ncbi:MAG: lysozyme inhibitor LprI family protein [Xanthomonadales bacterium]|jgi:uncharacterized protein YecT (DUF1311 family)|nr:lysozyme inhibitor LprI family protein [Xanthomonadales bacterium]
MKIILSLVSLTLVLSPAIRAQDGECRDSNAALTQAAQAFAAADAQLNLAWKAVKPALNATQFKQVLDRQRAWIQYRDVMAATSARGRPSEPADAKGCADFDLARADLSKSRTAYLKGLVKPLTDWNGSYADGFGGQLLLEESAQGLRFTLNVVRSEAYHTGGLSGIADLNAGSARFETRVPDFESAEENATAAAALTLRRDRVWIVVEGENTSYFHGARAYFDGEYVRVAPLSTADREEIARAIQNGN